MKTLSFLVAAAVAAALSADSAGAKTVTRHYDESFDVSPGATLVLSHGDGDVTIEPWSENRIHVVVDYESRATGILTSTPEFSVDFEQKGNRVKVTEHRSGHSGLIVNVHRVVYTYAIKAPAWVQVTSDGDDGDIAISGWTGKLDLTLDDGDFRLKDITAPNVSIRMQDGDASLERIAGDLTLHCDDGNIEITDAKLPTAVIEFQDGDCVLTRAEGRFRIRMDDGGVTLAEVRAPELVIRGEDGHVRAELLSVDNPEISVTMDDGDIDLAVPEDLSAAFSVQADDGTVTVKLVGARDVKKGRRSVDGVLHDGKGRIRLETMDGSIQLRQAGR